MSTPTTVAPASPPGPATKHLHASHDEPSPGEIAVGVIIGRTSEFFDFFVYAIASVIVFPKLVFPYLRRRCRAR